MKRTSPKNNHATLTFIARYLFSILLTCILNMSMAQTDDTKVVISERAAGDIFGSAVDISGDYAIVGAPGEDEDASGENSLQIAGSAFIYKKDGSGNWQLLKKLVASDRASPDYFGSAVAISGDLIIVGAHLKYEDNETIGESGAAYIFQKDLGGVDNWGEVTKIIPADRAESDYFGISVDISDDYAIVGAYYEDEDASGANTMNRAGSAYVFKKDEGGTDNWGELTKLVAGDRDEDDQFGYSVAISGDYIAVGARQDEHDETGANPLTLAGSAYLFQKDQGGTDNWGEVKKLIASDRSTNSYFGWSIAMSGNNILVGSNGRGAYLFGKDEGGIDNWGEVDKLLPADFAGNAYGQSVSINGDNALVGAPEEDYDQNGGNLQGSAGAAYLFVNDGSSWLEAQKFIASDRAEDDRFGSSVGINSSGESIVGAPDEDEDPDGMNTLDRAGSVYFFPAKSVQAITFEALPTTTYGDAPFELVATSSSGLPVQFTAANPSHKEPQDGIFYPTPEVATISGSTVTVTSAGTIEITATQAGDESYWSARATQTLLVDRKTVTATADNYSRDYRAENPTFTVSYNGFLDGEDESMIFSLPEVTSDAHSEFNAGEYPIEVSGGFDENYQFDYVNGTLTINKLPATVTVDSYTIVYGEYPPEFPDYTITGLADPGDLSGTPEISYEVNEESDVGTYPITIGGLTSDNYTITFVNGTLTITQAALTATANDQSRSYGEVNPDFTFSYTGFVNGDDESVLDTPPAGNSIADQSSNTGTYAITASGGEDNNYSITHEDGTLTITQASLMTKADDKIISYGDPLPEYTITYSGFVNGDDESVLVTTPSAGTESTPVNVGEYGIFVSGGSAQNYSLEFEGGTLTIDPAELLVEADDQTKVYGDANPELKFSYSGFVNDEDENVLDTAPTINAEVDEASNVGSYPIVLSGGAAQNYELTLMDGILHVDPALLTVSAVDASKTYGEANPAFDLTYQGFVNNEDAGVLSSVPSATSPADVTSGVGSYLIIASGGAASNYSFTYEDGTLTVTPAELTVSVSDASKTYGETNPTFTVSYSGFVNNEDESSLDNAPSVSSAADATSGVGTYPITASGGADQNYLLAYEDGTLTIEKAELTATADDLMINEGDELPPLTITYSGFVNDDDVTTLTNEPSASIEVVDLSIPGTFDIILSGGESDNYSFTLVNGTLTINEVLAIEDKVTIEVYPNPATNFIRVNSAEVNSIEVLDMNGRVIKSIPVSSNMEVSELNQGIYMLRLMDHDGKVLSTNRLIKR